MIASKESIFPATRWSLLVGAKHPSEAEAQRALGELCQSYWYPLYTCARRSGLSPSDAEDCVQGFLQRMLANRSFETIAKERGRLRAFLQVSIKNFITQQWIRGRTQKRGGGALHLAIDQDWGEKQFQSESSTDHDAATDFDRSWAYSLLHSVFVRLEDHYEKVGKRDRYEALKGCLKGDGKYDPTLAGELGLSNEGLRAAVFKLRRRFREYIEDAVRETCADAGEAREEICYLCQILAR